jgi:hypothetical protein
MHADVHIRAAYVAVVLGTTLRDSDAITAEVVRFFIATPTPRRYPPDPKH